MTELRTPDGKRFRSTHEWLRAQGDVPVAKFRIFDPVKELILEGWKNLQTKARIITKLRRPGPMEIEEFRQKSDAKGREKVQAKMTKELIDRRLRGG